MQAVTCPYHYLNQTMLSARTITLGNGNVHLEMLALSLNRWARVQGLYGTPVARHAEALMQLLQVMPVDMQVRALAAIYGEDAESLVNAPPGSEPAPAGKEYRSTGANGFTEQGAPSDYDTAAGSVFGYRTWGIKDGMLSGAYGGEWPQLPESEGRRYTAKCKAHGCRNVPNEHSCGCGFWAYWQPSEKNDIQYSHCIIGVIEGSGKVILGENGFRSQYAVIKGLAPAESAWLLPAPKLSVESISRGYRVPVFSGIDEMVKEIGTDPVYSPWARYLSVFTAVPVKALNAYLVLLDNASHIIKLCSISGVNTLIAVSTKSAHSKLSITQETELVKKAITQQAARAH